MPASMMRGIFDIVPCILWGICKDLTTYVNAICIKMRFILSTSLDMQYIFLIKILFDESLSIFFWIIKSWFYGKIISKLFFYFDNTCSWEGVILYYFTYFVFPNISSCNHKRIFNCKYCYMFIILALRRWLTIGNAVCRCYS